MCGPAHPPAPPPPPPHRSPSHAPPRGLAGGGWRGDTWTMCVSPLAMNCDSTSFQVALRKIKIPSRKNSKSINVSLTASRSVGIRSLKKRLSCDGPRSFSRHSECSSSFPHQLFLSWPSFPFLSFLSFHVSNLPTKLRRTAQRRPINAPSWLIPNNSSISNAIVPGLTKDLPRIIPRLLGRLFRTDFTFCPSLRPPSA